MSEQRYQDDGTAGSQLEYRKRHLQIVQTYSNTESSDTPMPMYKTDAAEDPFKRIEVPRKDSAVTGVRYGRRKEDARKKMDEITRPELDAKLQVIEARMDARLVRLETVIDAIADDAKSIKASTNNFKWWAIGTVIATGIALYAANISLLSGFVASFESGRNVGVAQEQAKSANQQVPTVAPKSK